MNRLSNEKSPYLLLHRDNPVDWYPWGEEALRAAREQGRPVLLSIGYSACHWCHVIARESFEDAEIAALLNADFISVKVDREERPDLDAVYMDAVELSTGSGGWPMTLLLVPDGRPFFAATYLPKDALAAVLRQAAALWREDRAALLDDAERLTRRMRALAERSVPPAEPSCALTRRAVDAYAAAYDARFGGFGCAPKFPSGHGLLFLLAHYERTGDRQALRMAEGTLSAMARGGIFDHIGGGFCRYSVDGRWHIPHFEKMLYDNALLLWAYAEAWRITGRPMYRDVANRTADYALREMAGPDGEFYCAQDADSQGREGAYYAFSRAELLTLLGPEDGARFCDAYGIRDPGDFEGLSIPNLIGRQDWPEDAALRARVEQYRRERMPLGRDDKVLTAWNALMITALCEAARALKRPDCLEAAVRCEQFLHSRLTDVHGAPMLRWRDGEARGDGVLSDHAALLLALLSLHASTGDKEYLARAERLAHAMQDHFGGDDGFFLYSDRAERLVTRPRETFDAALPSGNSLAALALWRLSVQTEDPRWRDAARTQLRFIAGAARQSPTGCGFGLYAVTQMLTDTSSRS